MRASRRAQRGVALLGLLAVAVMVFAYVLTSRLNAASQFVGIDRDHNAKVLAQAKRALVGWMAMNAAGTDNNPGRLPCPQAWGDIGTTNEGRAAGNCSVPAVGWLPWRTLGLDQPLDASGNQIWYVISPGWHLPSAGATLSINSDFTGQLTLDGQAAVALVVAPGASLAIAPNADQIAAGCAARNQSQVLALPGTPPDPLDFLECQNGSTADNVFAASVVDNAVNPVFNDQVLAITAADIMPALEAAIAERMQREIAPALRSAAYTSAQYVGIPPGEPLYPFAVPFSNPGSSTYVGSTASAATGSYQGLLPVHTNPSNVTGTPRETLGYGTISSISCGITSTHYECEGDYEENSSQPWRPIYVELNATFREDPLNSTMYPNVVTGLRALDANPLGRVSVAARNNGSTTWIEMVPTNLNVSPIRMNNGSILPDGTTPPKGSVTVTFGATLPNIDSMGWGTWAEFRVRIERQVLSDHPLLSASARRLVFNSGAVEFKNGQTLTGETSDATGKAVVLVSGGSWAGSDAEGDLFFESVTGGPFNVGENLQVGGFTVARVAAADTDIGWFMRNQWFRTVGYAVARHNAAEELPSLGCSPTDSGRYCLRFNDASKHNMRALLLFGGRSLANPPATRPNSNLNDYVEGENANSDTLFEQRLPRRAAVPANPNAPWNDRVVLVDWHPSDEPVPSSNGPQVLSLAPLRVHSLP